MASLWSFRPLISPPTPRGTVEDRSLDRSEIQEHISRHEGSIRHLDIRIAGLLKDVRDLQLQKFTHQQAVSKYLGLITLARKLPPELLALIFELCVQDGYTRTPLYVSHVCSEWREATKAPTLWRYIHVSAGDRNPYARTAFWLSRARNVPLRITLDVGLDVAHISSSVDMLLYRASDWETFSLDATTVSHANQVLDMCARVQGFQQLRTVSLSVAQETTVLDVPGLGAEDFHPMRSALREAPLLNTLHVARPFLPEPGVLPSHLTVFTLHLSSHPTTIYSISALASVLTELANLRDLSIALTAGLKHAFILRGNDHPLPVVLPDLQSLTLVGTESMFEIVEYIQAPVLRRLLIRSCVEPSGEPSAPLAFSLRRFIEGCAPPIDMLELHDIDLPPTSFAFCFANLRQLKHLRLHESDIEDDDVLRLMNCPSLSTLELRWCGQVSGKAIIDLVEHKMRRDGHVPVGELVMINCSFVEDDDIVALAERTVCRLVITDENDYCRPFGCCQNERYRRRLQLRRLAAHGMNQSHRKRLII
ncbi:hypothetical protein BD626DRAFT_450254 [Schizophyllum amplum]|uniref:F-box domain-containing protein n=1 Tax=Schizophyllum amplum TaxID=97359 RepID=A0A550CTA6_9AGAR|nr:hypothetical protein BD626DRAFT_450254 [Auriculariopsis ampla]